MPKVKMVSISEERLKALEEVAIWADECKRGIDSRILGKAIQRLHEIDNLGRSK